MPSSDNKKGRYLVSIVNPNEVKNRQEQNDKTIKTEGEQRYFSAHITAVHCVSVIGRRMDKLIHMTGSLYPVICFICNSLQ
jgi:hypothetical protein